MIMLQLFLLLFSFNLQICLGDNEKTEGKMDTNYMNQQAYKSLFAAKRREHIETAEKILHLNDYAKQYKMVEILGETIFPAMKDSKEKLEKANYIPQSSPFPTDKNMQEALGVVLESIPFFGDVLLRLPDITKDVYKRHKKDWVPLFKWGMEFCQNSTFLFTGHHSTQLYLMSQEIGLIPEDPEYENPFRKSSEDPDIKIKLKTKSKKFKKGPKLRTRNEL
ncbi:PREDICTED: coiled-coil domain-containing protein 134-like [Amphimedon queenslandica]|uniref:Coiled-coil domain-containing protein 134 n=1 Tax=Amphimedon queenslandica TaxID=400682 RepID=A0A1X7VMN8_AMPQE|nr:PREDICTED: coiled-coil domain-containing protein 134-like [Amphimedon queenslandica]|eukprot:XP_019863415.1 PREDICTED: coiled-coil domain-containing protein 134-like [Amphimedon queenslandica]